MRHESARAMYVQVEDALRSITMQLRSAIQADAEMSLLAHGGAVAITPLEVALVVRDNGAGLGGAASRSSGGGIGGMRARAQSHGGLCVLAGIRDAGTIVTVRLPIPSQQS